MPDAVLHASRDVDPGCIGSVASIDGSKVAFDLHVREGRPGVRVTVGNVVRIAAGPATLVGLITTLSSGSGEGRSAGGRAGTTSSARSWTRRPARTSARPGPGASGAA